MSNKWLEEMLNKQSGFMGPTSLAELANAITIRQYQRAQGFPITRIKFKVDGQWRDVDEIMAGLNDQG